VNGRRDLDSVVGREHPHVSGGLAQRERQREGRVRSTDSRSHARMRLLGAGGLRRARRVWCRRTRRGGDRRDSDDRGRPGTPRRARCARSGRLVLSSRRDRHADAPCRDQEQDDNVTDLHCANVAHNTGHSTPIFVARLPPQRDHCSHADELRARTPLPGELSVHPVA
jgi:hypothetical protein